VARQQKINRELQADIETQKFQLLRIGQGRRRFDKEVAVLNQNRGEKVYDP
jgi:hypothetical protein